MRRRQQQQQQQRKREEQGGEGEEEGRQDGERVTNERPSAKRELIQRTALPPSHDLHHPAVLTDAATLSLRP